MNDSARPSNAHLALLFIAITWFLCLGNNALPLIDRDEPRFAEASREMLQSGDWVVPRFNNAPRYDKPPLIYWMQVACYQIFGDNNFAARFPAALCTAATALLIALWGSRLATPKVGLQAAFIYTLCLQSFVHGRAAVADPPLILFSVAAAWAGWEWLHKPAHLPIALIFWTSLALGFLAKGPIAWIPIGMTGWALWKNRHSTPPKPSPLAWIGGTILLLALVCTWGVPALLRTRGEFASVGLGEHVVNRSLVSMEGHGAKNWLGYLATLPFYFVTIFPSFAPWSFWLPAAIRSLWRRPDPATAYLLSGAVLTFGIFTLSRTKLPHYTLPAFPYLALLLAIWWQEARPSTLWLRTALATALVFTLLPLLAFPFIKTLSATESLMARLSPELAEDCAIALVDYREPSLIWAVRAKVKGFPEMLEESQTAQWLAQPGNRICILTASAAQNIPNAGKVRATADGWNFAKGKRLSLVALAGANTTPLTAP